jgi:hypothetical protein
MNYNDIKYIVHSSVLNAVIDRVKHSYAHIRYATPFFKSNNCNSKFTTVCCISCTMRKWTK